VIALVVALALVVVPSFKSPSGNVRCFALPNVLHCDIERADYAARLQDQCSSPKGEMGVVVAWRGFDLTRTRKGEVACSGGALLMGEAHSRYATLPYGRTWRAGTFTCSSAVAGVTCRNHAGHGFFASRRRYRLF
jgi:hypothetical protein